MAGSLASRWVSAIALGWASALHAAIPTLFGFPLSAQERPDALGASRDNAPAGLLLLGGEDSAGPSAWDGSPYWHFANATSLPKPLQGSRTRLQLALTNDYDLFWLVLEAWPQDCENAANWLRSALKRKYRASEWQQLDGYTRLDAEPFRIGLQCAPHLRLEYQLPAALETAYEAHFGNQAATARRHREQDRSHVLQLRTRQVATRWLRGTRTRVESLYGLNLNGGNGELTSLPTDQGRPFSLAPERTPFQAASHEILVDPEGGVIRLESKVPDEDQQALKTLEKTLQALFGAPYRRGRTSARYRIGSQWLITEHKAPITTLVYLNQFALKASEGRLAAQEQAQFEADSEGL